MNAWLVAEERYPDISIFADSGWGGTKVDISYERWLTHLMISNLYDADQSELDALVPEDK